MNEQITEADIEQLCKENPIAGEMLRRIMLERQKNELLEVIKNNGLEDQVKAPE